MQDWFVRINTWVQEHKKISIVAAFIFIVLIVVAIISSPYQRVPSPRSSPRGTTNLSSVPQPAASIPPTVSFASYENRSTLPILPSSLNTYTLKTNYSVAEAVEFGKKFGMNEVKSGDPKYVVMSNLTDMNNRGMLVFDKETGGFSFQSWGDQRAWNQESGIKNQGGIATSVSSYLSSLGVIDPTVSCPVTYQKQGLTGITYVECHRDWNKTGGNILNFIGLLNTPEETSLSSLSLGKPATYTPDDSTIINTSDGMNGKARLTDFNSITVGLTDDGRILTIDSNLRPILQTTTVTKDQLLTPENALSQFQNHQSQLTLTIPAGSGSVDWNKVYPNNLAIGKKAIITDYLLTYLEKPGQVSQANLVPMYIIRGTAELTSGYTVRFTETIPALKSKLSFIQTKQKTVAGDSTSLLAQQTGLQLKQFYPSNFISPSGSSNQMPSPTNGTGGGTVSPTQPPNGTPYQCITSNLIPKGNTQQVHVPGIGDLTVIQTTSHVFYYQSANFPVASMKEVRVRFFQAVSEQFAINVARWLKDHPQRSPQNGVTPEKFYQLFSYINETEFAKKRCFPQIAPIDIACIPEIQNTWGQDFSIQGLRQTAEQAADKLVTATQQNTLQTLSDESDILPLTARQGILDVFLLPVQNTQDLDNLDNTVDPFFKDYLRCYISGDTPSLYLNPQSQTELSIHLPSSLSFSYPSAQDNEWNVTAHPDGTLFSNRTSYSRLYYEYDKSKVSFSEPKEGFMVKRDEWERFIRNTLASKLGLTARETDDLVTDMRNTLVDVKDTDYSYLKISFVDVKEIDEQLPVTISPKPDSFTRIHLLLTPLTSWDNVPLPIILPVTRTGFTALELGARLAKK